MAIPRGSKACTASQAGENELMAGEETELSRWELAAESIVVKLRWFGVVMGYILVQTRTGLHDPWAVRGFSLWEPDTPRSTSRSGGWVKYFSKVGRSSFRSWSRSSWRLLCYHDTGLNSPFRWYYLLSLICCSIRYRAVVAWWTVAFHTLSLLSLAQVLGGPSFWDSSLPLTITIMVWVTWASSSLAGSLHEAGEELVRLNAELALSRANLERRVDERTEDLRASEARVIQQEKMAAFGLLAAGIATRSVIRWPPSARWCRSSNVAGPILTPTKSSTWPPDSCSGSSEQFAS